MSDDPLLQSRLMDGLIVIIHSMKITRPSVFPPVVRPSVVLSAVSSPAFLPRVAYALLAASCLYRRYHVPGTYNYSGWEPLHKSSLALAINQHPASTTVATSITLRCVGSIVPVLQRTATAITYRDVESSKYRG